MNPVPILRTIAKLLSIASQLKSTSYQPEKNPVLYDLVEERLAKRRKDEAARRESS